MADLIRLRFPQTGAVITVAADDVEAMKGAGFKVVEAPVPTKKAAPSPRKTTKK